MADDPEVTAALAEEIEDQILRQGVASFKVSDGEVFMFTKESLENLLVKSQETGRVVVFVQNKKAA